MPNTKRNEIAVRELYKALNRQDLVGILDTISDQIELVDFAAAKTLSGREAVEKYFQNWLTAFRDGTGEISDLLAVGDHVVIEVRGRGTHTGIFHTLSGNLHPTGRTFEINFCQVFRLKSGRIASMHSYYDATPLMEALGLQIIGEKVA